MGGLSYPIIPSGDTTYVSKINQNFSDIDLGLGTLNVLTSEIAQTTEKVNDLSEIVSTMNPSQSTTQTATGYDKILSLPKNAANGNASFNLKGMTAQNLVVNGDFSGGATSWSSTCGTGSVSNKILSVTGSGTGAYIACFQNLNILSAVGKKIYFSAKCRVTDSSAAKLELIVDGATGGTDQKVIQTSPAQNQWYTMSAVFTQPSDVSGNVRVWIDAYYADAATASGKVMEVKEVMAIDLTALFGSGLEPDLATCDKLFANWFDSMQSTASRGRVRCVGKNLFDKSKSSTGYVVVATGVETSSTGYTKSDFIKVTPNTQYFQNKTSSYSTRGIVFYDSNKQYISGVRQDIQQAFTTPSNCAYLKTCFDNVSGIVQDTFQLELGSTATIYEPYKESSLYLNELYPLRRVPNGIQDEIQKRSDGGYEVVRRCAEYTVQASDVIGLGTSEVNVDVVSIAKTNLTGYLALTANETQGTTYCVPGFSGLLGGSIDSATSVWKTVNYSGYIKLIIPNDTYANLAAAQAALAGTKLTYQLATPIVTPIETSGTLLSYPSGSVYWESVTADAGIYNNGMSILNTSFPISSLESISKVDFTTGVETALDVSLASIGVTGLSFTHPSLSNGDIVFFTYNFASTFPEGYKAVSYYDSRYVVADSTNGKFYTWKVTTTNGVPSLTATEVT